MSQSSQDAQSALKKSPHSNQVKANSTTVPKDDSDLSKSNVIDILQKIIHGKKNMQSLSKAEIQKYLRDCNELQGQDPKIVNEFLVALFSHKPHRIILIDFIRNEPKKVGLKFRMIRLWMKDVNALKALPKENLWVFFDILKEKKYLPERFEPGDSGCAEVTLCAFVQEEIQKNMSNQRALSYLSYATFLLARVITIPSTNLSMDLMPAIKQFTPIAHKMGACDKNGMFFTKKMSIDQFFSALMTSPEITKTPNFIKALSLIQAANIQILPQVLRQIHDHASLKTFETELKEYYSHLANIFIPNLLSILNILRQQEPQKSFAALHQAVKFILEFPVDLFPQVEIFIHCLTRSCIKNINIAPIKEILEVVKLNNFVEIRNKKKFLLPDEKTLILETLLKNRHKLEVTDIEMLMHCRFTLFIDEKDKFAIFEPNFKTILTKKQDELANQENEHFCETELYKYLLNILPRKQKRNLKKNFVCPDTGREIDMVFIQGNLKIAIHIEGRIFHYYLDREERNRNTLIRNKALQNAGWINVCEMLPDKINPKSLDEVKNAVLEKLRCFIKFKNLPMINTADGSPVLQVVNQGLQDGITTKQINDLLALNQPDLVEEPINQGLKNRFIAIRKCLTEIHATFKTHIVSRLIAQYDIQHAASEEFNASPKDRGMIFSMTQEILMPYTALLFTRNPITQPNSILLCSNDALNKQNKKSNMAQHE